MGRLPKPPDQVRRPDRQRWRRLDAPSNPDVPALPEPIDGGEWTAEAVTTWGEWWRSPMATAWIEADAVALRRALRLVDDAARGRRRTDSALVALLDRLGLTPAGRLRLQWLAEPEPRRLRASWRRVSGTRARVSALGLPRNRPGDGAPMTSGRQ
jgi:hypothetical protein